MLKSTSRLSKLLFPLTSLTIVLGAFAHAGRPREGGVDWAMVHEEARLEWARDQKGARLGWDGLRDEVRLELARVHEARLGRARALAKWRLDHVRAREVAGFGGQARAREEAGPGWSRFRVQAWVDCTGYLKGHLLRLAMARRNLIDSRTLRRLAKELRCVQKVTEAKDPDACERAFRAWLLSHYVRPLPPPFFCFSYLTRHGTP